MKIVLLALDREPARARRILRADYPQADIEDLPLARIETASVGKRLRALRSLGPDAFAVSTERLAWQQGQNALLLFGALGGARNVVLFDPYGGKRAESRARILLRAPFRLVRETSASWRAVSRARRELAGWERVLAQEEPSWQSLEINREATPRIIYLRTTPAAAPQSGGATTHTTGFINAAIDLGMRVSVISNDRIAGLDESKVSMKLIEPEPLGLRRVAFDLRNGMLFTDRAMADIEKQPPDFIYQRYSRLNWTGVTASLRTKRPLFLEYNGSEFRMVKHWGRLAQADLLERCERLNLAAAARIFVVAEVERNNLIDAGVPPARIVVNPNGVDIETFRPRAGGEVARRELGIGEDEVLAGFVGTFGPWHGVLTLAEAITILPLNCPVRFLLVGAGMHRDEAERIICEAGRGQQVLFTGLVEHGRVPALLDACDILLSPHVPLEDGSEFFGSPTKLFEYMAMGKAIVASRLGQIGEVITDDENGLLIEPGNTQQLAHAIQRLAESADLRLRLGEAARHAAIERHTWKQNAQRVMDEYDFLMKSL